MNELDARGQRTVGIVIIHFLARERVEGKERDRGERMDMCGDLWYFAVAVNSFMFLFGCIRLGHTGPPR